MYAPSAVKLDDLPGEDEEEPDVERELPDFVADEEEEEDDEEEEDGFFSGEEESPPREPHVSVVLSSTSWADRDTDGLRALSPGSSMAVSS